MGVGAAASEPGTLSIIRHVYPDRETRADALGIWAAVSGLALALGPVVAGALVGFSSWRAIFWFNLGFGILAFTLAAAFVPESSDRQGRSIDVPGFIFGAAFLSTLSLAVIQGEDSGYLSSGVVALFVLSAVAAVAFVVTEHRVRSPMLDLKMFRRAPFSGSMFVAFVAYFGTFSIFFFTALYLQVVVGASAYQTAVDFLPMAAGLILASALTGPLVARIGPRIPMTVGCLLAGTGILVASAVLGPHVGFGTLGWVLPLAGIGIGMLLVPVTSVPLTVVPPERSGMAASATNTSREMGAVFGVAILGAIVNAKLTGDLAARLKAIGIPPNFQSLVLHAVQTGGTSGGAAGSAEHSQNATVARIATKVINAAYEAFGSGLHLALDLSGALILAGAVVAWFTIHRSPGESFDL
jgi:MFS family permease